MTLLIVFIIVWALSPGPVAVMTIHKTKQFGAMSGIAISCGATVTATLMVIAGVLVQMIGITSLEVSEFMLIEWLGGLGIIGMGLYAGYKSLGFVGNKTETSQKSESNRVGFVQGMAMMATYIPQAVIFYSVIVPKSVDADAILPIILALGTLKVLLILVWHSLIAIMASKAQGWLSNRRVSKGLDLATACLLIGLGINILV